jgi:hypothetical protein
LALTDRNLTCQYLAITLNPSDSGCDSGLDSGCDSGCATQSNEFNNALADFSPKAAGRCTGLALKVSISQYLCRSINIESQCKTTPPGAPSSSPYRYSALLPLQRVNLESRRKEEPQARCFQSPQIAKAEFKKRGTEILINPRATQHRGAFAAPLLP